MREVEIHSHSFLPGAWPFKDPATAAGFTTDRLLKESLPILRVFHSPDGDWQFFNGDIADDDECKLVCLGCMFTRDNTIGILSSLPCGWFASRESIDSSWECEPYEENGSDV